MQARWSLLLLMVNGSQKGPCILRREMGQDVGYCIKFAAMIALFKSAAGGDKWWYW